MITKLTTRRVAIGILSAATAIVLSATFGSTHPLATVIIIVAVAVTGMQLLSVAQKYDNLLLGVQDAKQKVRTSIHEPSGQ